MARCLWAMYNVSEFLAMERSSCVRCALQRACVLSCQNLAHVFPLVVNLVRPNPGGRQLTRTQLVCTALTHERSTNVCGIFRESRTLQDTAPRKDNESWVCHMLDKRRFGLCTRHRRSAENAASTIWTRRKFGKETSPSVNHQNR